MIAAALIASTASIFMYIVYVLAINRVSKVLFETGGCNHEGSYCLKISTYADEITYDTDYPRVTVQPRDYPPIFISFRFVDGMETAKKLQAALLLQPGGIRSFVCDVPVGSGDIREEIVAALDAATVFVVIGTATYGRKTMSRFSTREELQYAADHEKAIFVVKMCDVFDEPFTRFLVPSSIPYALYRPGFGEGGGDDEEIERMARQIARLLPVYIPVSNEEN